MRMMVGMERQLHLLTDDDHRRADWRLDAHTRAIGRQGLARARAALRAAARPTDEPAPAATPRLTPQSSTHLRRSAA
jgi:hypothetical protein